jgi:amino acid transporter
MKVICVSVIVFLVLIVLFLIIITSIVDFVKIKNDAIAVQKQLTCVCPECYYGPLCQFRLLKYSTTFDSLLGNSIVVVVMVLMALFGLIESLIHYHGEKCRDSELLSIFHWSMVQKCFLVKHYNG